MKVVFKKDGEYIEVADVPCIAVNGRVPRHELIDKTELIHNGHLKHHLDHKSFEIVRISKTEQAILVEEELDIQKFFNPNYYKPDFENKIIGVCSSCKKACCWYGMFFCEDYRTAGTEKYTVKELREMNGGKGNFESEDYWSDSKMKDVYGDNAPFGYREVL